MISTEWKGVGCGEGRGGGGGEGGGGLETVERLFLVSPLLRNTLAASLAPLRHHRGVLYRSLGLSI